MCLLSRVVFVTVLTCAAVVPFVGLHAAKAYPTVAPVDAGEQPFVRSYRRFGLLSSGSGQQTGPSSETAERWRSPSRDASPVQYLQPSLPREGHLGYNLNAQQQNGPHVGPVSHIHRAQRLEGAKLATSTHSVPQLSRMNHNQFIHMQSQNGGPPRFAAPHNGNSQPWHLPIVRKSQQGWPMPQRSASQFQKADGNDQFPRSGASTQPESRNADTNWESPDNSPSPFRSSGYWSSQTHSQEHTSDNRETNAGVSAVRTSTFPSYLNQRSFIAPSVSNSKGSSVAEPEKLTSPVTLLSRGRFPQNGNEKTSYKRVQSSLLGHSHTSEAPKGANTPHLQHSVYKGRDFDQGIRPNFKSAGKGDHPASVIIRATQRSTLTSYDSSDSVARNVKSGLADTSRSRQPNENGRQKERFSHSKGFTSSSDLKKNKELSKETNLDLIGFRLVRPSRLQKYSFEQKMAPSISSRDVFRHSSSEFLDATTPKEHRSESAGSIENERSGALSGAGRNEETTEGELAKSADDSRSVSLTGVKPQPEIDGNAQWEDGAAKDLKRKAFTYDDIIGSASFSSVTPAKNAQGDGHFEKPPTRTTAIEKSANTNQTSGTEEDSVGGKALDFTRGEAESELGISDWSVKEEEREAKSVPRELPSDPEENIESDSLLELDYLRTSTGNVSFLSLNLNM